MARVAFIVADMFEDSEFRVPYDRLREAGHEITIIGLEKGKRIEGKQHRESLVAECGIREVSAADFDAIVIPGGYSPDKLRMDPHMVDFTRAIYEAGKPTAAVCHAPWMLAEAGIARGKTVTSWPSIRTDLVNAGAKWVDQMVVEDGNVITSRKPDDLQAFSDAILRHLDRARAEREPVAGRARS
jgi:protease I